MKTLNLNKMESVKAGGCAVEVASGITSVWSLGFALASTGVLAPAGVALALVGLGLSLYSATQCEM